MKYQIIFSLLYILLLNFHCIVADIHKNSYIEGEEEQELRELEDLIAYKKELLLKRGKNIDNKEPFFKQTKNISLVNGQILNETETETSEFKVCFIDGIIFHFSKHKRTIPSDTPDDFSITILITSTNKENYLHFLDSEGDILLNHQLPFSDSVSCLDILNTKETTLISVGSEDGTLVVYSPLLILTTKENKIIQRIQLENERKTQNYPIRKNDRVESSEFSSIKNVVISGNIRDLNIFAVYNDDIIRVFSIHGVTSIILRKEILLDTKIKNFVYHQRTMKLAYSGDNKIRFISAKGFYLDNNVICEDDRFNDIEGFSSIHWNKYHPNIIYATRKESNEINVFVMMKRKCFLKTSIVLPTSTTSSPILTTSFGYLFARSGNSLFIYNTTHNGKSIDYEPRLIQKIVIELEGDYESDINRNDLIIFEASEEKFTNRISNSPLFMSIYNYHYDADTRTKYINLLLFKSSTLIPPIEIGNFLSNLRLPSVFVALGVFVAVQYFRFKKKNKKIERNLNFSKQKNSDTDMIERMLSERYINDAFDDRLSMVPNRPKTKSDSGKLIPGSREWESELLGLADFGPTQTQNKDNTIKDNKKNK